MAYELVPANEPLEMGTLIYLTWCASGSLWKNRCRYDVAVLQPLHSGGSLTFTRYPGWSGLANRGSHFFCLWGCVLLLLFLVVVVTLLMT
jgi:hypothetical protein